MTRIKCSFCDIRSRDVPEDGRTHTQIAEDLGWTVKSLGPVTLLRDPCCVEASGR